MSFELFGGIFANMVCVAAFRDDCQLRYRDEWMVLTLGEVPFAGTVLGEDCRSSSNECMYQRLPKAHEYQVRIYDAEADHRWMEISLERDKGDASADCERTETFLDQGSHSATTAISNLATYLERTLPHRLSFTHQLPTTHNGFSTSLTMSKLL